MNETEKMTEQNIPVEKTKRSIPFGKIFGCGCLLIVIGIAAAIFLFFSALSGASYAIDFLNNDIEVPTNTLELSSEQVLDNLAEQTEDTNETRLVITEDELGVLLKNQIGNTDTFVDIQDKSLLLYWPTEIGSDKPLYLVAKILIEDNTLAISEVGTNRIALPQAVTEPLIKAALKAADLPADDLNIELLNSFLPLDGSVKIEDIKLENDSLIIDYSQSPVIKR